ncbi:LADA_0F02850g1_1 [Lachancea dasiensis]|uniref:LADA_0F02850g1_1 n=1 Tax=Lachancea dasiensis TaxID=1072105 RepID=A0A1G4JIU8_9SACH|nr:LADA_0F02850g1_1 [Lachancea dasiensis]
MGDIWREIRRQQDLSEQFEPQASDGLEDISSEQLAYVFEGEDDDYMSDHEQEYEDEVDYDYELLTAQQQWEESLEQLSQVLNWVLLPLLGKFLGRRTALRIWKNVMDYMW